MWMWWNHTSQWNKNGENLFLKMFYKHIHTQYHFYITIDLDVNEIFMIFIRLPLYNPISYC